MHTKFHIIWTEPKMVSKAIVTVTQVVISQLLPHQNLFLSWVGLSFKYPDYKLQWSGRPGQPHTEVSLSGFGHFLSSVTNGGSRNRLTDSQSRNLELSRPSLSQCCQSVNMLLENLLYATCQRGYVQDAEQDRANPLGGRPASRQVVGVHR